MTRRRFPLFVPAQRRRFVTIGALLLGVLAALLSGCADFSSDAAPRSWQPAPTLTPEHAPNPRPPGRDADPSSSRPEIRTSVPAPHGCQDFNPAVIATCLNPIDAVAALPGAGGDPIGLAAERPTGRILRVRKGQPPVLIAALPVDPTGDGGLTGLALSPTFSQDQLVFAYITTPTDNRVVRIAPNDTPKPVLTGIPRGAVHNRGALAVDHQGALLVATGDAGDPATAANPDSLSGKVLRIDVSGAPAPGNPISNSVVVASGLTDPGGTCTSLDGSAAWVTDRATTQDLLYRLHIGQPLGEPAWSWPDRPGVAGCAAFRSSVMVATAFAGDVRSIPLNADGSFAGPPRVALNDSHGFGRISGVDIIDDRAALAGTVNKDGGTPLSSDDRAVLIAGADAVDGGRD